MVSHGRSPEPFNPSYPIRIYVGFLQEFSQRRPDGAFFVCRAQSWADAQYAPRCMAAFSKQHPTTRAARSLPAPSLFHCMMGAPASALRVRLPLHLGRLRPRVDFLCASPQCSPRRNVSNLGLPMSCGGSGKDCHSSPDALGTCRPRQSFRAAEEQSGFRTTLSHASECCSQ